MALVHLNYFSQTIGMAMSMDVILPEASQGIGVEVGEGWNGRDKLRTLYLLHGFSDDHTIWQRRTSIERYVANRKMAVVMPTTHVGSYTNQAYGFNFYDYVAREVPATARSYFPLSERREDNYVAGLSMGGYGALKIGLRGRDEFSAIIALSGGIGRMRTMSEKQKEIRTIAELRERRAEFEPAEYRGLMNFFITHGSPEEHETSYENNLELIARAAVESGDELPRLFMSCGTEDFLIEANREYHQYLLDLGIDHVYEEHPGVHDWAYWDRHIQRGLDWIDGSLDGEA